MSVVACGQQPQSVASDASPAASSDACAFTENVTAPGVGPVVVFVTRGPGAQSACDAELGDPRNKGQDIRPAYVPSGTPTCAYRDTHDPPPEGGRTYEIYGDGATTVCQGMAPGGAPGPSP